MERKQVTILGMEQATARVKELMNRVAELEKR